MKALVTGGGGFLGGAIVRQLLARGDEVRSFARGDYPELAAAGTEVIRGDLGDPDAVAAAAEGVDVVFHVAAKAGIWGPYDEYHRANLLGTESVLAACRRHGVKRLVHTSTPSVVFDGRDEEGIDGRAPYPSRFFTHYQSTKAAAERLVLEANGEALRTVALRPHLIWGPGDPHLIPRLLERARSGKLRLVSGSRKLVDSVYVDNAASAHLAAADRLAETPMPACAGRAYFVSQGEPIPMAELLNRILATADLPPVTRSVPFPIAWTAGVVFEVVYGLLRRRAEPKMTRFLAHQLRCAHWFDVEETRRDLRWEPTISYEEGLARLRAEQVGGPVETAEAAAASA